MPAELASQCSRVYLCLGREGTCSKQPMPSPPSYPSTSSSPPVSKAGIRAKSVPLSTGVTPDRSADKPKAALQHKTRAARPPARPNRFGLRESDTSETSSEGESGESDTDDRDTPQHHRPGKKHQSRDSMTGGGGHSVTPKRRSSKRWSADFDGRSVSPLSSPTTCVLILMRALNLSRPDAVECLILH